MKSFLILLLLLPTILPLQAQSAKVRNMESKRASIASDIAHTGKLLAEKENSSKKTLKRIELLSRQIGYRKQLLEVMSQEIEALTENITHKEKQIEQFEKEIEKKKTNYITSIRKMYIYKNRGDNFLFIFSANSMSQSYQRILYLRKYSQWQKETAKEIAEQQDRLTLEKQFLENDKKVKQSLIAERLNEEIQLVNEEKSAREELEALTTDKKKLEAQIVKKQKEAEALDREIEKIIREEQIAAQKAAAAKAKSQTKKPNNTSQNRTTVAAAEEFSMTKEEKNLSLTFAGNKGKLPYPLKGNYRIVRYFGEYTTPEAQRVKLYCNGLEIETTTGNDARCVFDGTVLSVFGFTGYDKTVIVKHGGYVTIYSNLESTYVTKGEKVKTGQSVGKIATDEQRGNAAILHFEIRKGETKQDPFHWLKKN
ncbi:MAG: peptidoglycan DD-metalloendopeptidase family protein [Dysgonamonadaceae bacterium]|jgi:septal ring factor EnvC (AmiA/AmiB activator)|nr:peptidoglycan DD-metalloendopeptidase family protein [Dysgonamonadaceae bacterium]